MAGYRLTDESDEDTNAPYEYSVINFGLERARTYLFGLHELFASLAENSAIGVNVGHIKAGYRRHIYKSHAIYYTVKNDGIVVARVLHVSQDNIRA